MSVGIITYNDLATNDNYDDELHIWFNMQNGVLPYGTGKSCWAQELSFYIGRREAARYLAYLAKKGDD